MSSSERPTKQLSIRSTSCGKGVFSLKTFRRGARVGQMRGRIVKGDAYDPDYAVGLDGGVTLEPSAPFRYLNHSCEPNCELVEEEGTGGVPEVWVFATRTIREGEQLLIDYAWPAEEAIPCLCQAATCRGWVVDVRWVARVIAANSKKSKSRASNRPPRLVGAAST